MDTPFRISSSSSSSWSTEALLPPPLGSDRLLRAHLLAAVAADAFLSVVDGRLIIAVLERQRLARHGTVRHADPAVDAALGVDHGAAGEELKYGKALPERTLFVPRHVEVRRAVCVREFLDRHDLGRAAVGLRQPQLDRWEGDAVRDDKSFGYWGFVW